MTGGSREIAQLGRIGTGMAVLVLALVASFARADEGSFKTVAEGLAATKAGDSFLVVQAGGDGAYRYTRSDSGVKFERVELFGANAAKHAAIRAAEAKAPPPAAGLLTHLWGTRARAWDGRVIPNEAAAVAPTLNLLPDPFNPTNESGGHDPAREPNTPATKDPLGGQNAMRLSFSGANQQLFFAQGAEGGVKGPWSTPAGSLLRCRLWAKPLSGPTAYSLGGATNKIDLTGDWAEYHADFTPASSTAISFASAPGNAAGSVAIAGAAIYDDFAGENLPTLQQLLDEQKSAHGVMPLKVPGAISFTPEGAIDNAAMGAGVRIFTGPDLPETPEYTLGVWFSPDEIENISYGTAITIGEHQDKAAKYFQGMLGIYSDKNTAIASRGRLRPFPTNNMGAKRTGQYLIGQGWQHLTLTVKHGVTTPYINGIPIYEKLDPSWKAPSFNALTVGYYMPAITRQNGNRHLPGRWQGAYVARKALSDADILQMDRHGRARLQATGVAPAPRQAVIFGMGGGDVAKLESWFWHLCENYDIQPRLHAHLEAQNVGGLAAWRSPERIGFITRQILAAADSYDEVWCFVPSGGSDESVWVSNQYKFDDYRKQYQDYLAQLKAIHPKVRIAAATALPRIRAGVKLKTEQVRQAWNDELRADFAEIGADRLLDIGLGTERIDAEGAVTPEIRPGGTVMGNWRIASASIAHQRRPAVALELSASAGDDIIAKAPAGTFTSEDMYRRVVAAQGSAQIKSVSKDGSEATLSTLGHTPKKYAREQVDQLSRDSIQRSEFAAKLLAAGEWSVEADTGYYQNGTDQANAGGRILGDLVAPLVQTLSQPASPDAKP